MSAAALDDARQAGDVRQLCGAAGDRQQHRQCERGGLFAPAGRAATVAGQFSGSGYLRPRRRRRLGDAPAQRVPDPRGRLDSRAVAAADETLQHASCSSSKRFSAPARPASAMRSASSSTPLPMSPASRRTSSSRQVVLARTDEAATRLRTASEQLSGAAGRRQPGAEDLGGSGQRADPADRRPEPADRGPDRLRPQPERPARRARQPHSPS